MKLRIFCLWQVWLVGSGVYAQDCGYWLRQGEAQASAGHHKAAIVLFGKGLEKSCIDSVRLRLLLQTGYAHYQLHDYKQAKSYALKTLAYTAPNAQTAYRMQVLAGLYCRKLNQFDSALVFLQKAAAINDKNKLQATSVYVNLQRLYGDQGYLDKQLYYTLKTLETNIAKQDSVEMAYSYYDVADVYIKSNDPLKAKAYYQKGIAMCQKQNSEADLCRGYEGLGICLNAENKPTQALFFLNKGLRIANSYKNPRTAAYLHIAMAIAFGKLGKYEQALVQTGTSEAIFDEIQYPIGKLEALMIKADAQARLKNYVEALNTYNKALSMHESVVSPNFLADIYNRIAVCYQEQGRFDKAFFYLKKYQAIQNDALKRENKHELNELTIKYETAQKDEKLAEQQVELLIKRQQLTQTALVAALFILMLGAGLMFFRWQQKRHIKQMESSFEQTAQQLQSFNYSVSHDLRHPIVNAQNALSKLSSLTPTNQQLEQIVNTTKSINQMKEIIDGLLDLAAIEKNRIKIKLVDTQALVNDIIESLETQNDIHAMALPTVQADVRLLREVFVNLIDNAIKYTAHLPQPFIQITALEIEGKVQFEIKDNGVGFDQRFGDNCFNSLGGFIPTLRVLALAW